MPSFGDISYYFALSVVNFSKSTVSLLTLIGFVALLAGTVVYNRLLKGWEIRRLYAFAIMVGFMGSLSSLIFALRINVMIGISDLAFIIFTSAVTDTFALAFSQMPTMVLFAKITPHQVEATVFAVLTGVFNFSNFVISPNVGVLVNKWFVGVTSTNLEKYSVLVMIQMCMCLTPLFLLKLIPSKD